MYSFSKKHSFSMNILNMISGKHFKILLHQDKYFSVFFHPSFEMFLWRKCSFHWRCLKDIERYQRISLGSFQLGPRPVSLKVVGEKPTEDFQCTEVLAVQLLDSVCGLTCQLLSKPVALQAMLPYHYLATSVFSVLVSMITLYMLVDTISFFFLSQCLHT